MDGLWAGEAPPRVSRDHDGFAGVCSFSGPAEA